MRFRIPTLLAAALPVLTGCLLTGCLLTGCLLTGCQGVSTARLAAQPPAKYHIEYYQISDR